jgi:hypothetical protein
MRKYLTISALILFSSLNAFGQINVQYIRGEKAIYNLGDTIMLSIQIKVPVETCLDGMNQTKFFQRGISIIKQSPWQEIKKGFWQKEISLIITGNKKGDALLTILRRNDKQSISYQEQFKYIQ